LHISKGEVCELIEMSLGEVKNGECPFLLRSPEMVNVMWIEWDGTVAFRKAIGRVEKSIWIEVATEVKDVTIG
jgi:hypothetical protein